MFFCKYPCFFPILEWVWRRPPFWKTTQSQFYTAYWKRITGTEWFFKMGGENQTHSRIGGKQGYLQKNMWKKKAQDNTVRLVRWQTEFIEVSTSFSAVCLKQRSVMFPHMRVNMCGPEIRSKIIGSFPLKIEKKTKIKFEKPYLLCVCCVFTSFRASGGHFG